MKLMILTSINFALLLCHTNGHEMAMKKADWSPCELKTTEMEATVTHKDKGDEHEMPPPRKMRHMRQFKDWHYGLNTGESKGTLVQAFNHLENERPPQPPPWYEQRYPPRLHRRHRGFRLCVLFMALIVAGFLLALVILLGLYTLVKWCRSCCGTSEPLRRGVPVLGQPITHPDQSYYNLVPDNE